MADTSRITQVGVEVIAQSDLSRVTQVGVEVIAQSDLSRVTQVGVEVIAVESAAPASGNQTIVVISQ